MRPGNHWCFHSQGHSRRWFRGHQWRHTKTPTGGDYQKDLRGRQTQSPSPGPTRPWKHVTFQDSESSSKGAFQWGTHRAVSQQMKGWGVQFRAPTYLEPQLEYFLGEPTITQGAEGGCNLLQEPFVENYEVWLELRGCQLNTPGLVGGIGGHPSCRQPPQTCLEGTNLFQDSPGEMQGSQSQQWLFFTTHPKMHQ